MKIILATDGSADALKAAGRVRKMAEANAKIAVVVAHVLITLPTYLAEAYVAISPGANFAAVQEETGQAILERTVAELALPADRVTPRLLRGHAVHALVDLAKAEQADLIVIGNRGLSGLAHLVLGSVSEGVARHAPCSVLIVR